MDHDPRLDMEQSVWLFEWYDSWSPVGVWQDKNEVDKLNDLCLCVCSTVGYIAKETEHSYVLAGSTNGNQWAGLMVIPKGAVKNKTELVKF